VAVGTSLLLVLRDSTLPPRAPTQKVLWLESGVVLSDYQQIFVPT